MAASAYWSYHSGNLVQHLWHTCKAYSTPSNIQKAHNIDAECSLLGWKLWHKAH